MSATDHGPADSPLTREQVLDELEFLAKVEHALIVECLSVCYALGYSDEPPWRFRASVAVTSWLRGVSNSRTALSV